MFPKVSIIIVSLNRADDLKVCLESIERQTYLNYEIIVLDNGSQDQTEAFIHSCSIPRLLYYRAAENLGTSYARNVGINLSTGDYIWFLDSDSELLGVDCLSKYIEYFEGHQQIGGIGGEAVIDEDQKISGVKLQRLRPNGYSRGEHLEVGAVRETDVLTSCNFLTTRKTLLQAGGFDLSYFFPYFDDVDLSYRIFKSGRKLVVLGGPFVLHKYSSSARFSGEGLKEALARLYFVLKEFAIKNILFLPLLDLHMMLKLENLGRIKRLWLLSNYGKKATVIRLTKSNTSFNIHGFFEIIKRLSRFLFSMVLSYFVIIPKIRGILSLRNKHINYLDRVDLKRFLLIKKQ